MVSVSRIDQIMGLSSKRDLHKRLYSAEETCNLIDPANRRHPIASRKSLVSSAGRKSLVSSAGRKSSVSSAGRKSLVSSAGFFS